MIEQIFQINYEFEPWTLQHTLPVILFLILGWWMIRTARNWSEPLKWKIPFTVSLLLPFSIVLWIVIRLLRGEFDITEDLPLNMCNLVTFFLPFIFIRHKPNQLFFGIIYFWVLSGTLQAVITPGLEQAFPHFWYFRYWLIHCGLVILILYAVIILKYYPKWRDLWNAFIAMNVLFVISFGINLLIGSNYLYTMEKPAQASILDYFGPWPVYLMVSEIVALGFFLVYFYPFLKYYRKQVEQP
ncbi:MAG: TIGR02206 family membrane protein [Saprospiraceae bacterium]|nr:TIGR02206 family membrane protein [Saprospiraceae bacterium]